MSKVKRWSCTGCRSANSRDVGSCGVCGQPRFRVNDSPRGPGSAAARQGRATRTGTAKRQRAPACPRVPLCLLDALRAGAAATVELRGKSYAVVASGKLQARRKDRVKAEELLEAARGEVAKTAGGAIPEEERRRMVLLTPQRPDGEEVRFEVVDAWRLIPSHSSTDFGPHPKYPEGVQERVYHLDKAEQRKVVMGAQKLRPEVLLARTPSPLDGPPIVTEPDKNGNHLVLGGNGRTLMLQRAYTGPNAAAQEYRRELIRRAYEFGQNGEAIRAAMERPVLVRVLAGVHADAPREVLIAAVRRTNEGMAQAIDAATLGVAQARVLSVESVRQLGEALGDGETSLRELMADKPDLFREMLQRDRILTPQNASQWMLEGGGLTDEAKDRLEAMFLGLALGTPDRIKATAPALRKKLERAVPNLVAVRGAVPDFDVIPEVQHAVDLLNDAARRKLTLSDLLSQRELVETRPGRAAPSARVELLARLFDEKGQRAVGEAFRAWAKVAIHDPRQQLLFGEPPTPETAFAALTGAYVQNPGRPGAGAQVGPCPRCAGTGRVVLWAGKIDWCPTCGGTGRLASPPPPPEGAERQARLFSNPSLPPFVAHGSPAARPYPQWRKGDRVFGSFGAGTVVHAGKTIAKVRWDGRAKAEPEGVDSRTLEPLAEGGKAPVVREAIHVNPAKKKKRRSTVAMESQAGNTRALAADLRKRFGAVVPARVDVELVAISRRVQLRRRQGELEVLEGGRVDVRLSAALAADLRDVNQRRGKRTGRAGAPPAARA